MTVRIVLDTHVWLDWLVFADPRVTPIKTAVAAGALQVVIDERCEAELARVLGYPRHKTTLDAVAQAACLAECRRAATRVTVNEIPQRLPRCRDPDDQKFLELAAACGAQVLVTRDQALLELVRRKSAPLPFRILTPEQASAGLGNTVSA